MKTIKPKASLLAIFAFVLLLAPLAAVAQEGAGSITVDVTDAERAPLAGVTLTILVDEKPRKQVTDPEGKAMFDNLPRGTYTVTAEIEGFTGEATADVRGGSPTPVSIVLRSTAKDGGQPAS